jgi:hypothetical protein
MLLSPFSFCPHDPDPHPTRTCLQQSERVYRLGLTDPDRRCTMRLYVVVEREQVIRVHLQVNGGLEG